MSNTSATGGYLAPATSTPPLEGSALEDFLQEVVVALSGLPASEVRPRWQPEPPNLPAVGSNWAAIGTTELNPDTYCAEEFDANGLTTLRHETITLLCSFYGPDAQYYASVFRDGLQVSQNREVLESNGFVVQETGHAAPAPTLVKEKWLYRIDLPVTLRRQIRRTYPVLSILESHVGLTAQAQGSIESVQELIVVEGQRK